MKRFEVEQSEERLREAMLTGDVAALDALISDRLMFVTHDGALVGKADDLAAHRSGRLRLSRLAPAEQRIELFETTAVVNVVMELAGSFDGEQFAGRFRYTRVWHWEGERAQVVAGHVSMMQS